MQFLLCKRPPAKGEVPTGDFHPPVCGVQKFLKLNYAVSVAAQHCINKDINSQKSKNKPNPYSKETQEMTAKIASTIRSPA